jgi:hypothetical protein
MHAKVAASTAASMHAKVAASTATYCDTIAPVSHSHSPIVLVGKAHNPC